jgi:hypothetical protein
MCFGSLPLSSGPLGDKATTEMSEIAEKIDAVVKAAISPLLRQRSFKGKGRTFHRAAGDVIQVVNVQASADNLGSSGRFTLNLGLYFPQVEKLVDPERVQRRAKEYECTVRVRISKALGSTADLWWRIEADTNLQALGDEVAQVLATAGLPWLDANSDLSVAVGVLSRDPNPVPRVAALLTLGRRDEAARILATAINSGGPAVAYHRRWGAKHDLV